MNKKSSKIRTPSGVLYFLVYLLIYPMLKLLFHLKVSRTGYHPPKGPFIVISNHQSFMDFLLVMLSMYPRRLNSVAAQKFFLFRPLDKLLPVMGCIPKNLFDPDIRTIRGIRQVIQRGGRVLLFPEGRCSVDGAYMGTLKSTGKLLKSLNVPVISCYIEGAYTCMPFWRKGFRLGRQRVTLANLFSADDTQNLSVQQLNLRIDRRLSGSDAQAPAKPFRLFRAKDLAEGLHNILYYCPNCHREFTLETRGNAIRCTSCGGSAVMDEHARLTSAPGYALPGSVHAWYKAQIAYEMQFLREDMEPVRIPVSVRLPAQAGKGIAHSGDGVLSLYPRGWEYEGTLHGENARLFFPIETVPALPIDPNDNFQIYSGGSFYTFTPQENPQACAKYATLGECAHWRFAAPAQMTGGYDSGFAAPMES